MGTGRWYFFSTPGWYIRPIGPMSSGIAYKALPWDTWRHTQLGKSVEYLASYWAMFTRSWAWVNWGRWSSSTWLTHGPLLAASAVVSLE